MSTGKGEEATRTKSGETIDDTATGDCLDGPASNVRYSEEWHTICRDLGRPVHCVTQALETKNQTTQATMHVIGRLETETGHQFKVAIARMDKGGEFDNIMLERFMSRRPSNENSPTQTVLIRMAPRSVSEG